MQRYVESDFDGLRVAVVGARFDGCETQCPANSSAKRRPVERVDDGIGAFKLRGFALAAGADTGEFPLEIFPDFVITVAVGAWEPFSAIRCGAEKRLHFGEVTSEQGLPDGHEGATTGDGGEAAPEIS